jgi:phosphoribosylanthranilate isomerase
VRTRIKICGVRDPETARAAAEAGADAIGLVFAEGSPRRVTLDQAGEIVRATPAFVTTVGLFVDAAPQTVLDAKRSCGLSTAQLHGSEAEDEATACGPGVIKAIRFDGATIERELRRWSRVGAVSAILVDGSSGGAGTAFDWAALARVRDAATKPIILAGGLHPENVEEAIRVVRPFAVDVSSGVERERGEKSPALITAFCDAARAVKS